MEKRPTPSSRTKKSNTKLNLPPPSSRSATNSHMGYASSSHSNSEENLHNLTVTNSTFLRPLSTSSQTRKGNCNLKLPPPNSRSTPNLNMSFASISHRNLENNLGNLTIANGSFKRPPSGSTTIDEDWERYFFYNDYLQEKTKALIIEENIKKHKQSMQEQIDIWNVKLEKFKTIHNSMCLRIDSYKQRSQLVEFIDILEEGLQEFDSLCDKYSIFSNATEINKLLLNESNAVCLKNIKPFTSQKDYDEFISTMENLNSLLETLINAFQNVEAVDTLAKEIKSFKELEGLVHEATERICKMRKETTSLFMSKASDMFAKAGGYA